MSHDEEISGISQDPVNILFNPSVISKKDVWQINIVEILKMLIKILEATSKKDLKVAGMAALSSSLIYRMKVESIFALQKAAMEKKPLINRRDVDIDILDMPYRHESTYPVSLDEMLDLLENLIGSIANPRSRRKGQLDFEPDPPNFKEYFVSFENQVEEYENLEPKFKNDLIKALSIRDKQERSNLISEITDKAKKIYEENENYTDLDVNYELKRYKI